MSSFWFTFYSLHVTLPSRRVFNTLPFPSLFTFFFNKPNPLLSFQSHYIIILFDFLFTSYYFTSTHHLGGYLKSSLSQVYRKKIFINIYSYTFSSSSRIILLYIYLHLSEYLYNLKPTCYHFFSCEIIYDLCFRKLNFPSIFIISRGY